jgi:hypothetical protein
MATAADEIEKTAALVATARRLLGEGRMVDLKGLAGRVETLCAAARELPPAEARVLAPALERLILDLDGLEGDLRTQFARATLQTDDSETRRQTARAYGRTDGTP